MEITPLTFDPGVGRTAVVRKFVLAAVAAVIAISSTITFSPVHPVAAAGSSGVVPFVPARLYETRTGPDAATVDGHQQGLGRVAAGQVVEIDVAGRGGVPDDATAVVLNVTAVTPAAAGFLAVYPCGGTRPNASNVNYVTGQVVANAVISKIGDRGRVCVYSLAGTDLVVDVNAAFGSGSGVVPFVPARLYETRTGPDAATVDGHQQGLGRVAAGQVVEIDVAGRGGVPDDATAVVLNVTAVTPAAAGFLAVYPCGGTRPNASNVNYVTGQVVANAVISKIGDRGRVCVYSLAGTDLVVDVNAAFGSGSGVVPFVPARLYETRTGPDAATVDGHQQGLGRVAAGQVVEIDVAGRGGVPDDATAVVLNVTAVTPAAAGFLAVYPCGGTRPNASNVNYVTGQVVANAVISKIGDRGRVCVYSLAGTDLVVDVNAAFGNAVGSGGDGSGGGDQTGVHRFAELPADLLPAGAGLYTLTTGSTQRSSAEGIDLVAGTSIDLGTGVPSIDISDVWSQVGVDEPPRGWMPAASGGDGRFVEHHVAEPLLNIDRSGYVSSSMSVAIGRLLLLRVDADSNVTAASSCSGTVVSDTMVLTAAHCLGWDWYVFVPGLMDDQQPVGVWWARGDRALANPLYEVHKATAAVTAFDYALVKFDPQFNDGKYLGAHTGAFPMLQDASTLPTKLALGYPVEGAYNRTNGGLCDSARVATTCRPYFCRSSEGLYHDYADDGRVMTYGCDDHGGASGGPVFAKVGDVWYVISVNAASRYFVDRNGNVCETRGCAWIMLNGKGPEFASAHFGAFVQAAVDM